MGDDAILHNNIALNSLKHTQLMRLCQDHGVSLVGTRRTLVRRLMRLGEVSESLSDWCLIDDTVPGGVCVDLPKSPEKKHGSPKPSEKKPSTSPEKHNENASMVRTKTGRTGPKHESLPKRPLQPQDPNRIPSAERKGSTVPSPTIHKASSRTLEYSNAPASASASASIPAIASVSAPAPAPTHSYSTFGTSFPYPPYRRDRPDSAGTALASFGSSEVEALAGSSFGSVSTLPAAAPTVPASPQLASTRLKPPRSFSSLKNAALKLSPSMSLSSQILAGCSVNGPLLCEMKEKAEAVQAGYTRTADRNTPSPPSSPLFRGPYSPPRHEEATPAIKRARPLSNLSSILGGSEESDCESGESDFPCSGDSSSYFYFTNSSSSLFHSYASGYSSGSQASSLADIPVKRMAFFQSLDM